MLILASCSVIVARVRDFPESLVRVNQVQLVQWIVIRDFLRLNLVLRNSLLVSLDLLSFPLKAACARVREGQGMWAWASYQFV